MSVTLHLIAQGADHLAVAQIAALANVDVAPGKLERGVGTHPVHLFDGALQVEVGHQLDQATDGNHDKDADCENDRVLLEDRVTIHDMRLPYSAGARAGLAEAVSTSPCCTVIQRL